jgi:molybdenum cofactor biosynthesis protein B
MNALPDTIAEHKAHSPGKLRFVAILVSDSRYNEQAQGLPSTDRTLDVVRASIRAAGHVLAKTAIVPDDPEMIRDFVDKYTTDPNLDVILTCGGTGISPRDRTVDAVGGMACRVLPGFGELFRFLSFQDVGTPAMMSRSEAFMFERSAVFCLPGSPKAVQLALDQLILPEIGHIIATVRKEE